MAKKKNDAYDNYNAPCHDGAGRHNRFQFGDNPLSPTEFEKRAILMDKIDRRRVRNEQTLGMKGIDGGKNCCREAEAIAEIQTMFDCD
jgi:hypothetical protein